MAVDWTIIDEIRLLRWAAEFKPAGVNKHFHMICIVERMNNPDKYPVTLLQKETVRPGKLFTAKEIWDKLNLYYHLSEVDKLEELEKNTPPGTDDKDEDKVVPNQLAQAKDFELPWDEYGELILENAKNGVVEEEMPDEVRKQEENPKTGEEPHFKKETDEDTVGESEKSITSANTIKEELQPTVSKSSTKGRATRLRKSRRLNQPRNSRSSSDEGGDSSKDYSDGEPTDVGGDGSEELRDSNRESSTEERGESKEESEEPDFKKDANIEENAEQDHKVGDKEREATGRSSQRLAKRARQSSQTSPNETSPKRKKRTMDPTASSTSPAPTRVSSRLRNRKQ